MNYSTSQHHLINLVNPCLALCFLKTIIFRQEMRKHILTENHIYKHETTSDNYVHDTTLP